MPTMPLDLSGRRLQRLSPEQLRLYNEVLHEDVSRATWYHTMNLGSGLVTSGLPYESVWDNIRAARDPISYEGLSVLDLASWDGLWAFEAEALGASLVVSTDCMHDWHERAHHGRRNLLLVRAAMFSDVIPLSNVPAGRLNAGLCTILPSHPALSNGFDVVHHLGLLYHLRDPMLSLAESRSVLNENGLLLVETACTGGQDHTLSLNVGGRFYDDFTTWWLPTVACLLEMLRMSLFEPDEESIHVHDQGNNRLRVALRARARPPRNVGEERYVLDPAFGFGFGERLIRDVRPEPGDTILGL
jgi:hypothetical protein